MEDQAGVLQQRVEIAAIQCRREQTLEGLEVVSMNSMKPTLIRPITAMTRATMACGRLRL